MTVETDASNHMIAGILSVTTQDNEIQPIAFFSHSLQGVEKNYDTHNKELLAMFKAFKNWCHFLEGSGKVINTVTDHKNLEYFMTSKKLSCRQARWVEFLAQFNMRVHFRPGRLGSKLDALTHRWDLYMDGDRQEPAATNVHPIFDSEHLAEDLVLARTGTVEEPTATAGITMDSKAINGDIAVIGAGDDFARKICRQIKAANHPEGWMEQDGCLLFHDCLYVPDEGMLCMQIIHNHHDHTTAGHFRETKIPLARPEVHGQ